MIHIKDTGEWRQGTGRSHSLPAPNIQLILQQHMFDFQDAKRKSEIVWKKQINYFIKTRINYEEWEALWTAANLRHNMLIQAHQDHLQRGGFNSGTRTQHQLDIQMLEEDELHRIENIIATVGENEYETYANLIGGEKSR